MWEPEKRNRTREALSKIFWASVSGSILGFSYGVLESAITRKCSIRRRTTDLFLLGGTYAMTEIALEKWRAKGAYSPIIAGCTAGIISSKGTAQSIITNSALAATLGFIFENRERLMHME
ncbi:hypothetical protein NEFER03_1498 [Nematocida sp. LUAm3]|nr:hypothetical protein NEFER03_1498 [Nematocida sp. LUAm3]KAI5174531.1 hypothetical protein NEFER02_0652 [Nematocida sp. LUAm2]KAI5178063.1 hypothetical protein NEFER01_1245 [Nematocida sp. LUAm1]